MGRHSSGKNNYALSKGAIAFLALIAILGLLAAYIFSNRSNTNEELNAGGTEEESCVAGDLALPVAASSEEVGRMLIDVYSETAPVVRDYCVRPVYVDSLAEAAVYIAPNTSISHTELEEAGRAAATNEPLTVASVPAGVAGSTEVKPDTVDVATVDFPIGDQPEASALVAAKLAPSESEAVAALTEHRIASTSKAELNSTRLIATAEFATPEGFKFSRVEGADIVYSAIPLTTSDNVTEDQARAGQAFADTTGKLFTGDGATKLPVIAESVWAAALPEGGRLKTGSVDNSTESTNMATAASTDTLFVLDTSAGMTNYASAAEDGIAQAAKKLSAAGHRVGLWNYSSPLSPGVANGYRTNVALGDNGEEVASAVTRFLNDGSPQTHEVVLAALAYAQTTASAENPVRIVLVTSGTSDASTPIAESIKQAEEANVELSVVHVGGGEEDKDLASAAQSATTAADAKALPQAIVGAAAVR